MCRLAQFLSTLISATLFLTVIARRVPAIGHRPPYARRAVSARNRITLRKVVNGLILFLPFDGGFAVGQVQNYIRDWQVPRSQQD